MLAIPLHNAQRAQLRASREAIRSVGRSPCACFNTASMCETVFL